MTRTGFSVSPGVARSAAALAMVSTVASIAFWSVAIMEIHTAFSEWLFNNHLRLAIALTAGLAAFACGMALMALQVSDPAPTSKAQARFALRCVGLAVLISAGLFLISRGQGR
jgi:hypothetical protein